jgi:predicted metal-binding membrane protein
MRAGLTIGYTTVLRMESATQRRVAPLPELLQFGLLATLLVLALVGWAITDDRMQGMNAGPGTDLGTLGFYITAWVVMMAAMMFPSIWPMVIMYQRVQRGRAQQGREAPLGGTALFVSGYLITWTAAGLVAFAVFEVANSLSIDVLSWDRAGPYVAGAVIVAAAAYQLTPLKNVCLTKCRNPLMFLMTSWQPGSLGALRMGVEHGAWCVGCCWMLMAALFAVGVMSLGWMVFIATLIAVEKLLPWRALANYSVAVVLVALGLGVAFTPDRVPGLTLPDSPEAMRAMQSMDGDSMSGGGKKMEEKSMPEGGMRQQQSMPGTGMDSGKMKANGP